MNAPAIESFRKRLKELEKSYAHAEKYRDKWQQELDEIEEKLEAFRVVVNDLGVASAQEEEESSDDDTLAAVVRDVVRSLDPGTKFQVNDIRPELGDYEEVKTYLVTKNLMRMVEDDNPVLQRIEVGRGKRQSRYVVLGGTQEQEKGGDSSTDQEDTVDHF